VERIGGSVRNLTDCYGRPGSTYAYLGSSSRPTSAVDKRPGTAPPSGSGTSGALRHHPLIAIGASAGGPVALATVLRSLPKDFPAAIVVIQSG
jgi:chemotaxis response regulator CheB